VQAGVEAELQRRDDEAAEVAARRHGMPSVFLSDEPDRELPPEEMARRQREAEAWRLQLQVHGTPQRVHEAETRQTIRRRAMEARLACRWCGRRAVVYEPKPAAWLYPPPHPRQGLPMEPATYDGTDRFIITSGTLGLCADHQAHDQAGDLEVAIPRAVLRAAGGDEDDALEPGLAERIAPRTPRHIGLATDQAWAHCGREGELRDTATTVGGERLRLCPNADMVLTGTHGERRPNPSRDGNGAGGGRGDPPYRGTSRNLFRGQTSRWSWVTAPA
jgi:hypothetical protein